MDGCPWATEFSVNGYLKFKAATVYPISKAKYKHMMYDICLIDIY